MNYRFLKKFIRCNEHGKEIENTIDVEKAKKWLETSEVVEVSVTDGTASKCRLVSEINKKANETIVKTVSGEVFHIEGNDSNERVIELKCFSLDNFGWEEVSVDEAKENCRVNERVFAIGYSNGRLVSTSRIKRFIGNESFETVSGSVYRFIM